MAVKGNLQMAALQKLAKLTQHDRLPSDLRISLRDRVLKRCTDSKKLVNGANGVTSTTDTERILVRSALQPGIGADGF
jgi:hypothetical protein